MSQPDKAIYAATCNPPRRVKRPRPSASETDTGFHSDRPASPPGGALQPRPILPRRLAAQHIPAVTSPQLLASEPSTGSVSMQANPPSKRGRKPGPLSRSAREAQRRLNHSIIEKARRTKINNALATLRELVPVDYGRKSKSQEGNSEDEDDADEDDADGEYSTEKKKQKSKPGGKKEEKEREYKLEILVRTVAFMQDLLHRVAVLEQPNPICSKCGDNFGSTHSTHPIPAVLTPTSLDQGNSSSDTPDPDLIHRSKRARTEDYDPKPAEPNQTISPIQSPQSPSQEAIQEGLLTRHRLPSISSWLPQTLLDPSIFNVSPTCSRNSKDFVPPLQLLTPPSSTQFQPAFAPAIPTSTNNFTSSSGSNHQKIASPVLMRTPEDEHAATMLLQISGGGVDSSPTFRPLPPSIVSAAEPVPNIPSLPSSATRKHPHSRSLRRADEIAVQTPASILGLITPTN